MKFTKAIMMLGALCFGAACFAQEPVKPEGYEDVPQQGVTEDYGPVVAAITVRAEEAIQNYDPSMSVVTGNLFSRLYFDIFESSGMEFTLNLKDSALLLKIESGFSLLISQAMRGDDVSEIERTWGELKGQLDYAVAEHSTGGKPISFWGRIIQSFLILFREGLEAMLVVAALVAYLRRSGYADKVKIIWWGCGLALIASVGTAWVLNSLIQASGASREIMEGVTMLIAAAVLIYVSYWLTAKRDADRWQAFIKDKMDDAITGGSLFALGSVSFLAVFREGAETILFYQALMSGSAGHFDTIWIGMGLAAVALVILYIVVRLASIRLPLSLFFGATAVLLFAMAFIFAGKGILEMQVAGAVPTTRVPGVPMTSWLGIFPTLESLLTQALVLATIPLGWLTLKLKRKK